VQTVNVARLTVGGANRIHQDDSFVASDDVQQPQSTHARFGEGYVIPLTLLRHCSHDVNTHSIVGQDRVAQANYQRLQDIALSKK